jgi:hypothetical protein
LWAREGFALAFEGLEALGFAAVALMLDDRETDAPVTILTTAAPAPMRGFDRSLWQAEDMGCRWAAKAVTVLEVWKDIFGVVVHGNVLFWRFG